MKAKTNLFKIAETINNLKTLNRIPITVSRQIDEIRWQCVNNIVKKYSLICITAVLRQVERSD